MANFYLLMALLCVGVSFTSYTARNALDASDGANWGLFIGLPVLPTFSANSLCGGRICWALACDEVCIGHSRLMAFG